MARDENPPFPRGTTWYDGRTPDSNALEGLELEGQEWVFGDINPDTGVRRTNLPVRVRVVRNMNSVAAPPKRLVNFQATAGVYGSRIDGWARTTAAEGYPVDEYLPSTGIPQYDLGYIVIEGPAVVLSGYSDMAADISVAGWVVAMTAATSGATSAGHVHPQDLTGATALLANQVQNRIGRALTAKSTNSTNADVLVAVGHW